MHFGQRPNLPACFRETLTRSLQSVHGKLIGMVPGSPAGGLFARQLTVEGSLPWRSGCVSMPVVRAFLVLLFGLLGCRGDRWAHQAAEADRRAREARAGANPTPARAPAAPSASPAVAPSVAPAADPVEDYIAAHPELEEKIRRALRDRALVAGIAGMDEEQVWLVVPPSAATCWGREHVLFMRGGVEPVVLDAIRYDVRWGHRWERLWFSGGRLRGWLTWNGAPEVFD